MSISSFFHTTSFGISTPFFKILNCCELIFLIFKLWWTSLLDSPKGFFLTLCTLPFCPKHLWLCKHYKAFCNCFLAVLVQPFFWVQQPFGYCPKLHSWINWKNFACCKIICESYHFQPLFLDNYFSLNIDSIFIFKKALVCKKAVVQEVLPPLCNCLLSIPFHLQSSLSKHFLPEEQYPE